VQQQQPAAAASLAQQPVASLPQQVQQVQPLLASWPALQRSALMGRAQQPQGLASLRAQKRRQVQA
jgi:hypothetical protein